MEINYRGNGSGNGKHKIIALGEYLERCVFYIGTRSLARTDNAVQATDVIIEINCLHTYAQYVTSSATRRTNIFRDYFWKILKKCARLWYCCRTHSNRRSPLIIPHFLGPYSSLHIRVMITVLGVVFPQKAPKTQKSSKNVKNYNYCPPSVLKSRKNYHNAIPNLSPKGRNSEKNV